MTAAGSLLANRYRLVNQIAVGGMGSVWEAWDEVLQRRVAVKQLLTQPGLSEADALLARNRVIREARITARLHHPNAVTLFDVVDDDERPCLIMQFVPSRSLSAVLQERGPLPVAEVSRIGADLASALAAAHQVGIVHRDVKPGNVLITEDGSAKLTDFGISHAVGDVTLTSTGMVSGTPAYLAPEVARGGESDFPADVFSLGATLYAALEGSPPFGTDQNPMAILHKVASGVLIPPRRSGSLTPLLLRMMAPGPADRPAMTDVADTLAGRHVEIPTPPEATLPIVFSAHTTRQPGPAKEPIRPAPTAQTPSAPNPVPEPIPAPLAEFMVVAPTPKVRPPSAPGRDRGRDRRRRGGLIALIAALAAVVIVGGVVLLAKDNGSVADSARSGAAESTATAPSVPESNPAGPAGNQVSATAESSASSAASSATTASSSAATSDQLAAAISAYYALVPANTDAGWAALTPNFQNGIAQDRQYYQSFWDGVRSVTTSDVVGEPPDTAEATISYVFKDGTTSVERTRFTMVPDGGTFKIDNSTVLTSQSN